MKNFTTVCVDGYVRECFSLYVTCTKSILNHCRSWTKIKLNQAAYNALESRKTHVYQTRQAIEHRTETCTSEVQKTWRPVTTTLQLSLCGMYSVYLTCKTIKCKVCKACIYFIVLQRCPSLISYCQQRCPCSFNSQWFTIYHLWFSHKV